MEVYRDPFGWAYAYPEGRRIGLCDQCFRSRRFNGLSPAEIEYFEETFFVDPEKESDA
jgi:hypothetical protein